MEKKQNKNNQDIIRQLQTTTSMHRRMRQMQQKKIGKRATYCSAMLPFCYTDFSYAMHEFNNYFRTHWVFVALSSVTQFWLCRKTTKRQDKKLSIIDLELKCKKTKLFDSSDIEICHKVQPIRFIDERDLAAI